MPRNVQQTDRELFDTAMAKTFKAFGQSLSVQMTIEDTGKIRLNPSVEWEKLLTAALCAVSALNERIKGAPPPKIGDAPEP